MPNFETQRGTQTNESFSTVRYSDSETLILYENVYIGSGMTAAETKLLKWSAAV